MLNRFKTKTQFIVITHNPRTTTEAADAVYGVTMQEPGVSSLVSVRMRGRTVDETITPAHPAHTPQLHERARRSRRDSPSHRVNASRHETHDAVTAKDVDRVISIIKES